MCMNYHRSIKVVTVKSKSIDCWYKFIPIDIKKLLHSDLQRELSRSEWNHSRLRII